MPAVAEQAAAIAFLADKASHPGAERVDCVETHGNLIFLAGDDAWKIKRAVRFPYMDFSTLALRHQACLAELEINRRLAPELYIACVPITRARDGGLTFAGAGEVVEWAVRMRRFAQSDLLSAKAEAGTLADVEAKAVADSVFASHQAAPSLLDGAGHARVERVLLPLVAGLDASPAFAGSEVQTWANAATALLAQLQALLDERARHGCVRRCHGDLHAANIVFWHGKPMLYDALEFDPELAAIDTLYDLAFLLMDLARRGQPRAANIIFNRYLWRSRDGRNLGSLAALPLFMSMRAAIRALVTAQRAAQEDASKKSAHDAEARDLLMLARGSLVPRRPRLIAVCGLSGSGKSTLAASLAPDVAAAPGALHLRTDLVRKALWNVEETSSLPATTYTAEASRTVYDALLHQAGVALAAGWTVIVDAVAALPGERKAFAALAARHGGRFQGLWLTSPEVVLSARIAARTGDASDATVAVLREQLKWDTGNLGDGWVALDASGTPAETHAAAAAILGLPADKHQPVGKPS